MDLKGVLDMVLFELLCCEAILAMGALGIVDEW